MALDAEKLLIQQAAGVVIDVHQNGTLAKVVVQAALIGRLAELFPPGLHLGRTPAAQQAHQCFGPCLDLPLQQGTGQLCHHQRVDIGRLVPGQDTAQHPAVRRFI